MFAIGGAPSLMTRMFSTEHFRLDYMDRREALLFMLKSTESFMFKQQDDQSKEPLNFSIKLLVCIFWNKLLLANYKLLHPNLLFFLTTNNMPCHISQVITDRKHAWSHIPSYADQKICRLPNI